MRTVPLAGQNQGEAILVHLAFATPIYSTSADRAIVYDGNTYLADGLLLDYKHPTERADAKVQKASITLAPTSALLTALAGDYLFRRVFIYAASLDGNNQVSGTPYLLNSFFMSRYIVKSAKGEKKVEIELFSETLTFRRRNGVIADGSDQKARSAGDTFFDFTDKLDGELNWGGLRHGGGRTGGDSAWMYDFFDEASRRRQLRDVRVATDDR